VVGDEYFGSFEKSIHRCFFFGDDDYERDLEKNLDLFLEQKMDLGLGFYYFLDYEESIAPSFNNLYEFEDYKMMVKSSSLFLSSSPQAILENLASGGRPVYLQREDYPRDFIKLFKKLNIPLLDGFDKSKFSELIDTNPSHKYKLLQNDTQKTILFIRDSLNL
jgi:hypothetical protein